ncbi:MAG: carbohydrate-binding family 9-like protein [Chitinophagaceae bacterium]
MPLPKIKKRLSLWAFMIVVPSWIFSQIGVENSPLIKVKKTTDFSVTGKGNDNHWKLTDWHPIIARSSTILRKENWNIPASLGSDENHSYKTQFKILYSEKGIYCLYICEDSIITSTIKEDYLNLYDEDVVEAFFWTDTKMPVYFEYELSPFNYELPLLIINNKGNIMGWRPWQYTGDRKIMHAVSISEKDPINNKISWTAEFFIPFTLLSPMGNTPSKKGTKWRANFYRIDYDRKPVYSSWQLTRKNYHDPERFGTLEFD